MIQAAATREQMIRMVVASQAKRKKLKNKNKNAIFDF